MAGMAHKNKRAERNLGGCLALPVMLVLFAMMGKTPALIFGVLMALAGFSQLGDGRRDPMTGFGYIAMGILLALIGLAMK